MFAMIASARWSPPDEVRGEVIGAFDCPGPDSDRDPGGDLARGLQQWGRTKYAADTYPQRGY
jgi:hypothetical protein